MYRPPVPQQCRLCRLYRIVVQQWSKPILLDLTAVWCHWCHVMDETSYSLWRLYRLCRIVVQRRRGLPRR